MILFSLQILYIDKHFALAIVVDNYFSFCLLGVFIFKYNKNFLYALIKIKFTLIYYWNRKDKLYYNNYNFSIY